MQSKEPATLETLAATLADVIGELRSINARLGKLETKVEKLEVELTAYQKGLDGMVRMATTIVVTAGAAVIFAPLIKEIAPAVAALLQPQ